MNETKKKKKKNWPPHLLIPSPPLSLIYIEMASKGEAHVLRTLPRQLTYLSYSTYAGN
jgi:hypothetical protein